MKSIYLESYLVLISLLMDIVILVYVPITPSGLHVSNYVAFLRSLIIQIYRVSEIEMFSQYVKNV